MNGGRMSLRFLVQYLVVTAWFRGVNAANHPSSLLPFTPLHESMKIVVPPIASNRDERFPSVEERIKVYMGNWYVPPCSNQQQATYRFKREAYGWPSVNVIDKSNSSYPLDVRSIIEPDKLFLFTPETIFDCARSKDEIKLQSDQGIPSKYKGRIKFRSNMRMYCEDAKEMISILPKLFSEHGSAFPVLLQFGDMKHSHVFRMVNIPHLKKFRSGTTSKALKAVTDGECLDWTSRPVLPTFLGQAQFSPIVWKLATHRHFRLLPNITDVDIPWEHKKDVAVFRGQLTGALENYNKHSTDLANCQRMMRCRLVLETAHSPYVDAKLTTTRKRLPRTIDGTLIVSEKVTVENLLTYKGIIMLEGNDVASGLKWALLSNSVVLMPPPTHTSWAMEELLVPWVHYVPLATDISDVEEKMIWIKHHSKEAQAISNHATMWMKDMEFHPDAKVEERMIKEEILRRYKNHFQEIANGHFGMQ